MKRVLGIDYGLKRTGLAISDPLGIIASPLETIETKNLLNYILDLNKKEKNISTSYWIAIKSKK